MNKQLRATIKRIILSQIDLLVAELAGSLAQPGQRLRLQRLQTTLLRIQADNFGHCFKCEQPLEADLLRKHPETSICNTCLTETEGTDDK